MLAYFPEYLTQQYFTALLAGSFVFYFYFVFRTYDKKEINTLLWTSLLFRSIFLLAIPMFSNNYSSYISSGEAFLSVDGLPLWTEDSVNLPLMSLLSGAGAWLGKIDIVWSLLAFRLPILIAEFLVIKYLRKLIIKLKCSLNGLLWYALNPFIIIEFSYHINFMPLALAASMLCIYFVLVHKWFGSALAFIVAVMFNLFPVLFLFTLLGKLGGVRGLLFVITTMLIGAICFFPFVYGIDQSTLALVVSNFVNTYISEGLFGLFNGWRWNLVGEGISLLLMLLLPLLFFAKQVTRKGFVQSMMLIMALFLLFSMNNNTAYIVPILLLSAIYQEFKFSMIWLSIAVFVPYLNIEINVQYWKELMVLTVIGLIITMELIRKRRLSY